MNLNKAKTLVKMMLEKSSEKRISLIEIYRSKWYLENTSDSVEILKSINKMSPKKENSEKELYIDSKVIKRSLQDMDFSSQLSNKSLSPPPRILTKSCFKRPPIEYLEDPECAEGKIQIFNFEFSPKLLSHLTLEYDSKSFFNSSDELHSAQSKMFRRKECSIVINSGTILLKVEKIKILSIINL